MANGNTSEVELTDVVFKMRHPERESAPLDPKSRADRNLVKEWIEIRREIVRSVMRSELGKLVLAPAAPKKAK